VFKKLIGWLPANLCYIIGDCVSKLAELLPEGKFLDITYDLYCWFMFKSLRISDWAHLDLWV